MVQPHAAKHSEDFVVVIIYSYIASYYVKEVKKNFMVMHHTIAKC